MVLFFISLCGLASAVAYRSIDPLVTSLAREFSVPVATAALVASAYALPYALGQPVLGPIGDSFGKGKLLAICLTILTLTLIAGAWVTDFDMLLTLRFIGGLAGGGTMPVAMALIGDKFPPEKRQVAIARFLAATLIGQILASTLSGLLAETVGWRAFFYAGALTTAIAATGAAIVLREKTSTASARPSLAGAYGGYAHVFRNPKSFLCFGTVFLESIAIFAVTPFISEILESNGLGGPKEAGMVIAGIGIGGLVYSLAVTWLMRHLTRVSFMAWGGVIGGLSLGLCIILPSWGILATLFSLLGFGFLMIHNSVQTEVASLAPQARAAAFSVHAFSFFMGQALGPVLFGYGLHHFGLSPTLLAHAVLLTAVGLGASALFARQSRELL